MRMTTLRFLPVLALAMATGFAQPKSTVPAKASGTPVAAIWLEFYSDFQCPFCKQLYEGTLRQVIDNYVAQKKVYLIHRDHPSPAHQYARKAAGLASAAWHVNPEKYERVCAALYGQQDTWMANGRIEDAVASVMAPAEMQRVRQLATDPKIAAEVQQELDEGIRAGVKVIPTMIITHGARRQAITGTVSYEILHKYLDQLLSK